MEIQFCGADREVTGSSHLIRLANGFRLLLDCGLYQGNDDAMDDFNDNFFFKADTIDAVILSHAHIDHAGRLPLLVKNGYRGPIYCTPATRSLCSIMLMDSAMIQERDAEYHNKKAKSSKDRKEPLYKKSDVQTTLNQMVTFNYDRYHQIDPNIRASFRDAGHILGSTNISLLINQGGKEWRIGFTGDIGRPNRPILRDPQHMEPMDFLICESTYGGRVHIGRPNELDQLLKVIKETCIENKGKLIIPAFSVGRTQEIVHMLDELQNAGKLPQIPVIVDSPLAVNATKIYGTHPECYDQELHEYMLTDPNPFGFSNLTYNTSVDFSKALNGRKDPMIIISASGMMNAGRVKHHLANNIEDPSCTILIVGYCAPDTPGGMLRNGVDKIKLYGEWKDVNARIEIMDSFSAHGDTNEMQDFIANQKDRVKKLFLVHGEFDSQLKFRDQLQNFGFQDIEIPKLTSRYKLEL